MCSAEELLLPAFIVFCFYPFLMGDISEENKKNR